MGICHCGEPSVRHVGAAESNNNKSKKNNSNNNNNKTSNGPTAKRAWPLGSARGRGTSQAKELRCRPMCDRARGHREPREPRMPREPREPRERRVPHVPREPRKMRPNAPAPSRWPITPGPLPSATSREGAYYSFLRDAGLTLFRNETLTIDAQRRN